MNNILRSLILFECLLGAWISASAKIDLIDGLQYNMATYEGGRNLATVQRLSNEYLNNGVPQYSGDIVIPSAVTYNGVIYTVNEIGFQAFSDCEGLTSITIPSTIERIGGQSFRNDNNLQAVYIEDLKAWFNIKFAGSSYCNPLEFAHNLYLQGDLVTDLVVPEGITEIGEMQFCGCNIKTLRLPEGVTSVEGSAFFHCRNLNKVELPESLKTIGNGAFCNCSELKEITLPSSLEILQANAFSGCGKLESIIIPHKIKTIKNSTFYLCESLKSIQLPETITEIEYWAFMYCNSLSEFELPRDLLVVGENAFSHSYSLPQLSLPKGIKYLDNLAFHNSTMWRTINIPETLDSLGYAAFPCDKLNILTCRCTRIPKALHVNPPFYQAPVRSVMAAFPTAVLDAYRDDSRFSDFMIDKLKINVTINGDFKLDFTKVELEAEPYFWGEVYDDMTIFAPRNTEIVCRLDKSLLEGCKICYNGIDITESLFGDTFILPALTDDATLEISTDADVERIDALSGEAVYYNLQGMRVTELSKGIIYIERNPNGFSRKILMH